MLGRNDFSCGAWRLVPVLLLAFVAGCTDMPVTQTPGGAPGVNTSTATVAASTQPVKLDPQIVGAIMDLVDNHLSYQPNITTTEAMTGNPIGDMLSLGSPAGYSLRNDYLNIGVPLSLGFAQNNNDPDLKKELVQLARWAGNSEARSAALMLLAQNHDPNDAAAFQEALNYIDPGVRFGAIEALILWQQPALSLPLLATTADQDQLPVLKVFAAGALARLGDASGLHRLRDDLNDPSWLIRAMAGRYLGDYGTAEDYDLLVSRLGQEQSNDFVLAEYCISALKLFPKKNP